MSLQLEVVGHRKRFLPEQASCALRRNLRSERNTSRLWSLDPLEGILEMKIGTAGGSGIPLSGFGAADCALRMSRRAGTGASRAPRSLPHPAERLRHQRVAPLVNLFVRHHSVGGHGFHAGPQPRGGLRLAPAHHAHVCPSLRDSSRPAGLVVSACFRLYPSAKT